MESIQIAQEIAQAFASKLGEDIKILHVEELTTLADYFVLVTGSSTTQVRALADMAEETAEKLGLEGFRREGRAGDRWVLLDLDTVIVHVFTKDAREYYQLDKLWADAPVIAPEEAGKEE